MKPEECLAVLQDFANADLGDGSGPSFKPLQDAIQWILGELDMAAKPKIFIAYDGESEKLYVAVAVNAEKAVEDLAEMKTNIPGGPGSDGDEFSIAQLPKAKKGHPLEVHELW